jgi:HTH-type transcriptional regulator/antitoxin MqsA
MNICKICKSDNVNTHSDSENISYKGAFLAVAMEYSVCNCCNREFISKQQIMNNDARVRDAKKRSDGLLTSGDVYDARITLGLTQEQASLVFGGGKNAFSKYERAEVSQSVAMDKLIKVCLKHANIFNELLADAGVKIQHKQLCYEDNIIQYTKRPAANQERFRAVKSMELMRDRAYG